jgi:hypothetical protein
VRNLPPLNIISQDSEQQSNSSSAVHSPSAPLSLSVFYPPLMDYEAEELDDHSPALLPLLPTEEIGEISTSLIGIHSLHLQLFNLFM